jgi:DNA repair exonuclease SbcCD nuclease subunit
MTTAEEQDVALKILHTADWHLGLRFPSFGDEDRTKLTRARIEAVDRVLGTAESYSVNAVLCAGDLFDTPAPDEHWWKGLVNLFQRRNWRDRPVFLLPGNHDPLQQNSVWSGDHGFRRALPSWVHVVDRDNYEFPLSEEAVLYAEPCRSQAGSDDLASRLPLRSHGDQRIRIGLVHGQTFDIAGHQTNFPIASDAAQQRGLNYLAIGDTHGFREKQLPPFIQVHPRRPNSESSTPVSLQWCFSRVTEGRRSFSGKKSGCGDGGTSESQASPISSFCAPKISGTASSGSHWP